MLAVAVILVLLCLEIFVAIRIQKPESKALQTSATLGFGLLILLTGVLLTFAVSSVVSPQNSLLDRLTTQAKMETEQSVEKANATELKTDEMNRYVECLANGSAIDPNNDPKAECKAQLSAGARAELEKQESKDPLPNSTEEPTSTKKSFNLYADCEKQASVAEKTACSNPKLNELNNQLKKGAAKRKEQDPNQLYAWWKDFLSCKDDESCVEKQINDALFSLSH